MENRFLVDSEFLSPQALARKHQLETDPSSRKSHMEYLPGMEQLHSDVRDKVIGQMESYDPARYTARDVRAALDHETCSVEDFKALLSPAAEPFLEEMAARARLETSRHFGNTVYLFTPLYIANYCENYCVYCGFNCYNHIQRMKLDMAQIEHEMQVIADSGMEEILILTGESRAQSDVEYIGEACKLARKYFRMVGLEIYPVNTDEYRYLHQCGADYVTVFQETYDADKYETLHLMGHKRVWPYRFDAQERALRGGMRGVAFSALLGLSDFRKDALASALHLYYLQRKYPHAEMSLSCPRLRPIVNNDKISPLDVGERQLCQVLCAYRIFLPFAGITVSSRESERFRNGIVRIAATKVSAGVSTGIGDHERKYTGKEGDGAQGDEQFGIWSPRGSSPSSTTTSMSKLICVTSRALCPSPFLPRLEDIARSGAGAILLREKDLSPKEYASLARPVLALCRRAGIPCILHGHPKAALALGADALHLPMPALRGLDREVRARFSLLGASCHSLEEAQEAQALGCTYLTLGHIFPTGCKPGVPPRGVELLRQVCRAVPLPVYAIGGISPELFPAVLQAGAAGACVMSGPMTCPDVRAYIQSFQDRAPGAERSQP